MIAVESLLQFYPGITNFKRQIYREYIQYLIAKKIFDGESNLNPYLAGVFYNRIRFDIPRFCDSIDLIIKRVNKGNCQALNNLIIESLQYEGYDIAITPYRGQFKIKINSDELGFDENDDEPIEIFLNYYNEHTFFVNNPSETIDHHIINKFDVCTRVNTIAANAAFTILLRKIIKCSKVSAIEIFDLDFFINKHTTILQEFFRRSEYKNLSVSLLAVINRIRKPSLKSEFQRNLINYSEHAFERISNYRSLINNMLL